MCRIYKSNTNSRNSSRIGVATLRVSEKQEKRRAEIALAVREIMKNSDFENITVDNICSATGIAKGTFYHYFSGKESLLNQTSYPIDSYFANMEPDILTCGSFSESISRFAAHYAAYVNESGLKMSRTVMLAMMNPKNPNYVSETRGLNSILSKIIEYWQLSGEIAKAYSVKQICEMFVVIFRGYILNWYCSNGNYDLSAAMTSHVRLFASSLLAEPEA